ncbi:SLC13 family permease [Salinirubellus salinus]|uniref:SLC13 family permease n=1 Tax=Salinirubellus salinus TaxID=1364945 RepID=A0A9E7R761_9EURY|nr:SLC13 family permease [Salinirubellus salinus]UWM56726.1 SLC13 family permease [Salinirubellus salinus]
MSRRPAFLALAALATAAVTLAPIDGLSTAGQYAVATGTFAAVCWVTGALPLPVTALCVPALLAGFGVYPSLVPALASFADPVVFLLFAGFALAAALQSHGLDRRAAFTLVARVGGSPRGLVFVVMVTTAGLSMLVSNSATAAMMAPIALGIGGQLVPGATDGGRSDGDGDGLANVEVAMLLGVAYAASIGGVGTIVGTPPNAIVVAQVERALDYRIGFLQWSLVGLPVVAVTLPVAWALLVRLYPPATDDASPARAVARRRLAAAGSLSTAARRTLAVTATTALLWVLGGLGFLFEPYLPERAFVTLFGGDAANLLGTTGHQGLLFYVLVGLLAIPALVVSGAAEWETLVDVDWGTLLLLGGGLSLADALVATDATTWLADVTVGSLGGVPAVVLVVAVVLVTIGLGELASNTAMTAILAPVLVTLGPAYAATLGTDAGTAGVFLAVVAAVASSFGFALPVATPPNAIVFGTGEVTREQMLRAGSVLDVLLGLLVASVLLGLLALAWPLTVG